MLCSLKSYWKNIFWEFSDFDKLLSFFCLFSNHIWSAKTVSLCCKLLFTFFWKSKKSKFTKPSLNGLCFWLIDKKRLHEKIKETLIYMYLMKFYFIQDCQFRENLLDPTKIEWHFIKTFNLIFLNSFKPNHVCCGHNIRKIKATCLKIASWKCTKWHFFSRKNYWDRNFCV